MAVTPADIIARYPELEPAGTPLIQECIDEATLRVSVDVWGDLSDVGIKTLTAHLLAISPFGQQARMEEVKGQTTYGKEYEKMVRRVASGFRIASTYDGP